VESYLLLKAALHRYCMQYVEGRIHTADQAMRSAQEAANAEGKSSAGDKYETGRAMMQIERDKAAQQLEEALKLKRTIEGIRTDVLVPTVALGCVVLSDVVNFYIAISADKVQFENKNFITIAPNAPVASMLMGLKVGDNFQFNGKQHVVRTIF
jgi:transcription elongation GreA/GreB family factor